VPHDVALGVLPVLSSAEDGLAADDQGRDRPVAAEEGLLGITERQIQVVGVGHGSALSLR
jgi:hypothetical protein